MFEREVACPECGFAVPAGGSVIEGAAHPINLGSNAMMAKVSLAVNVLIVLFSLSMSARAIAQGSYALLISPLALAGISIVVARESWRRSRRAKGSARAAPAGREVRWVVSPAGITIIDRRNAFRPPQVASHAAACLHRIVGEPAKVTVRDKDGERVDRGAALLTAWTVKVDSAGRAVDLVPASIYTLDGLEPGPSMGRSVRALVDELEASTGIAGRTGFRGLPIFPLSTPAARLSFMKALSISGLCLAFVVLSVSGRLSGGLGALPWMMTVFAMLAAAYFGTLGVSAARRRGWVRRNLPVPTSLEAPR
ncbi:MAG: hypothetical protein FGM39_11125 [Phycisphaerales bacterium]|nr:hypothetical protein [Phycisphaerales bacterium]